MKRYTEKERKKLQILLSYFKIAITQSTAENNENTERIEDTIQKILANSST